MQADFFFIDEAFYRFWHRLFTDKAFIRESTTEVAKSDPNIVSVERNLRSR